MPTMSGDAKAALKELAQALRDLHRSLVEATRREYEKEWGPVNDAGQLLQLLTRHPKFGWLHQLSEFIVDVDELLDQEALVMAHANVRRVLSGA